MWSLEIKNVFLQATVSYRDVFLRVPARRNFGGAHSFWVLDPTAYGLYDVLAAFHKNLWRLLPCSDGSLSRVVLWFQVSSFSPSVYSIFFRAGGAVGAVATHIDDVLGCGELDLP